MLLILLSWIYLFATTLIYGVSTTKLLGIKGAHPVITSLIGCFSITLLIGFWAVFGAVNKWFYLGFFIISLIFFGANKTSIHKVFQSFKTLISNLSPIFKACIGLLFILVLAKCACAPFIIDNETYYIQTIKWLNEYGFTKGLTNLHLFLGQQSGWHILQSGFNFAFVFNNLNDISGFCLLLGNIYAIDKLNNYTQQVKKNRMDLITGLFPVFNVFLFQFIGAPSPDIAIYVIGLIVFYEFVNCYKTYNSASFYAVFLLSVFATFIKLTGIVFFVLAVLLYCHYYIYTRRDTLKLIMIGLLTLTLFLVKNWIISGNLLYPLHIEALQASWSLPNTINSYFSQYEKAASYGLTLEVYSGKTSIERFIAWVMQTKLDGVFNKLLLLLFVIAPFCIPKTKAFKQLYVLGVVFLVFLFLFSPQYRFYFPFLMLFTLVLASVCLKHNMLRYSVIVGSLLLPIIPMLVNINTSAFTQTKDHQAFSTFSYNYLLAPHRNSKYNSNFETISLQNHSVNSPNTIDFIWATGDIPLPAVNKKQLEYLGRYFNVSPQQVSNDLGDGFTSKTVIND